MEIRHLKSFAMIVQLGSFVNAAKHLGYAQSTITSHIKAIEAVLGSPLFDRIGKKNILTETGENFLPHAKEMLRIYELSTHTQEETSPSGTIMIGAPESLTIYKLLPVIKKYNIDFPNVDIILKTANGDKLCEDLRNGEIDIALLLENPNSNHRDLTVDTLKEESMSLIFPFKDYNINEKNNTVLFTQVGCGYRTTFERFLSENDISVKSVMEFSSIEAIKQLVMSNIGIALLPTITIMQEMNEGKIHATSLKDKSVTTLLAYHKNKWLTSSMKEFINLMKDESK